MTKFNPLNFVANHAGMNLADAIKEAYEQGKRDAQPEQPSEIQDILYYLDTVLHPIISPEHWNVYSELHDMISTLQFAQPERKKGEWIVCGDKHVCSECDEFALCDAYDVLETGEYQEKLSDFCPNCGADMR